MMDDHVVERLRSDAPRLRALGVLGLYLFGSVARGEEQPSDVDIFIDYEPDRLGLIELATLQSDLSLLLEMRADLTTRDALHPLLRSNIEAEARQVF